MIVNIHCCNKHLLPLKERTLIMGILNLTPDSFSGDGIYKDINAAVDKAWEMINSGADIIDLGGESTRPGSESVSVNEELSRVMPVLERLSQEKIPVPISIDTYKPEVASRALEAGACILNDIYGLRQPEMLDIVIKYKPVIIIMHMLGTPKDMQMNPVYNNCVNEIIEFLKLQTEMVISAGLPKEKIIVDPGIGFGKTVEHNLEIIRRLNDFKKLGFPLLIGTSRKSFIGKILNIQIPNERVFGTAATLAIAINNGANIIRVHDVPEMIQVARMCDAIIRRPS